MVNTSNYGWPTPDGSVGVAPDVPGDMKRLADGIDGTLAAIDFGKRRCSLQLNGQVGTNANQGDVAWDTVLSDPSNMRGTDAHSILALWNGRYAVGCRVALQGDVPNNAIVSLSVIDQNGTVLGAVGQWGLPGDQNIQYFDELTFAAGASFRFRLGWGGNSGARSFSYGNDAVRTRLFARYLGAA